jgi:type II secretory pathway pseudopilin PulG
MTRHRKPAGFTLVELMLSMAFISMLLLAIAMLVIQISGIYTKGLTLKAVNESGQVIVSELQRALNTAKPQQVEHAPSDLKTASGGRFCIGTMVYAWNYDKPAGDAFNKYEDSTDTDIRLVKFPDRDGAHYCLAGEDGTYPDIPTDATRLLKAGDNNLALHSFALTPTPVAGDSSQYIYAISFTLGTNEKGIIDGNGCSAPESVTDDEYCAVNEFNFTARAGNK